MIREHDLLEMARQDVAPVETLAKVADAKAMELWGEDTGRGEPIPLANVSGRSAYLFPYIRGARQFPSTGALLAQLRDLRDRHGVRRGGEEVPAAYHAELRQLGSGFGSVCVSAGPEDMAVLWASHFLPSYFLTLEAAQEEAVRQLGADAEMRAYYYFSPEEQVMEFASPVRALLVDPLAPGRDLAPGALLRPALPKRQPLAVGAGEAELVQAPDLVVGRVAPETAPVTAAVSPGPVVDRSAPVVKRIDHWQLMPMAPHTPKHWCVVASKAMVLGFYDNYVDGVGTCMGFGRFIDHWYEMASGGYNVPNLADEMLPGNDAATLNGYSWIWKEIPGDSTAWWNALKAEIDAGRPCFFSIPGHTTAALGYRIDASGKKFVIVYDPPNPSTPTHEWEYAFSECIGVGTVVPTGSTAGENLILIEPDGGETFHTSVPNEVIWFSWGNSIQKTRLSLSPDGGNTWQVVAGDLATKGAWNGYAWIAAPAGARVRVKVEGLTSGGTLIAADGSFENLQVTPAPSGSAWKKVWGPTAYVVASSVAGGADLLMYGVPLTGDGVYRYDGSPMAWTKIGGPGKLFALDDAGHLYGLSPDGSGVYRYDGSPMQWTQVGGPATAIYAGGGWLFATSPQGGDILQYSGTPMQWTKVGGPGKTFAVDRKGRLYGVSPDGNGIYRHDGPSGWTRIGDHASALYAGGCGLFAVSGANQDVYCFHLVPYQWTRVGGPGKMFAVDDLGRLYGLSPDASAVMRYDGAWNAQAEWTAVGGAAWQIFAGGSGRLFATNPQTGDLMSFE